MGEQRARTIETISPLLSHLDLPTAPRPPLQQVLQLSGWVKRLSPPGEIPASNNGLVAYTPSRGVISVRGNWPLYATCDVVVPHTRTVKDMLEVLDVVIADDEITVGDLWRDQPFVKLPKPSHLRPLSYKSLAKPDALRGKHIAVPKMDIGHDGKIAIKTRQSILHLWYKAKTVLESLGATVIETDFPLMEKYDSISINQDRISNENKPLDVYIIDDEEHSGLRDAWDKIERKELVAYAWDDFLKQNKDPAYPSLTSVNWETIFPRPPGSLPDRYTKLKAPIDYAGLVESVKNGRTAINEIPGMEAALKTLEHRRKVNFEDWLDENEFDAVVFPANADVGKEDSDKNEESAQHTWQNGVMYSNGNRVWRHLGIPTVSVTMGTMDDTRMPVGLTSAGKAYEDNLLLELAFAYENASRERTAPAGTPELESDVISSGERQTREELTTPLSEMLSSAASKSIVMSELSW
jgi:amidase